MTSWVVTGTWELNLANLYLSGTYVAKLVGEIILTLLNRLGRLHRSLKEKENLQLYVLLVLHLVERRACNLK